MNLIILLNDGSAGSTLRSILFARVKFELPGQSYVLRTIALIPDVDVESLDLGHANELFEVFLLFRCHEIVLSIGDNKLARGGNVDAAGTWMQTQPISAQRRPGWQISYTPQ